MASTTSRPRVVRTDEIAGAARAGVARALRDRGAPQASLAPATTGIAIPDPFSPDPISDPFTSPAIAE